MSRFSNLEFDGAEEHRSGSPARDRDDLRYLEEASAAFQNAEFEKALRAYARAIEFNPHGPASWVGQVRALIELGEFREANLWADQALARFPSEPELMAAKAVSLGRLGQLEEALALSDEAVQAGDELPYVWLARADVFLARQEGRSDFCFDKALLLAAQDWVIRWLAARIHSFYRQFALALKMAQDALVLRADHPILWMLAGQCQQELGLLPAARHSYTQALQLDSGYLEARHALTALESKGMSARLGGWWRRTFGN